MYPCSIFVTASQTNDISQTRIAEIGKSRKRHNLQQQNQSLVFILPSKTAHSRRALRFIVRGLMAVARALCSATGGPQLSGQSASLNLCPPNYSGLAHADTIIKSVSERLIDMFLPGISSGTMFACPGVSHALRKISFSAILRIFQIF